MGAHPCRVQGCQRPADHGWGRCSVHRSRTGWPDLDQLEHAKSLLRHGYSLSQAAHIVGCLASHLDQTLWDRIGLQRRPMF